MPTRVTVLWEVDAGRFENTRMHRKGKGKRNKSDLEKDGVIPASDISHLPKLTARRSGSSANLDRGVVHNSTPADLLYLLCPSYLYLIPSPSSLRYKVCKTCP
jgi:hypothetical protein